MAGLAARSHSASSFSASFDQQCMSFEGSAKLKLSDTSGMPLISKHHPLMLGGSPVLSMRRQQHRRSTQQLHTLLPPLEEFTKSKGLSNLRHASLPPSFDKASFVASSPSTLLWGGVQKGPALRPNGVKELSAMEMDMMADKKEACLASKSETLSEAQVVEKVVDLCDMLKEFMETHPVEVEQAMAEVDTASACSLRELSVHLPASGGDILLPGDEIMDASWFSFGDFEAQVGAFREKTPAPKKVVGFELKQEQVCGYMRLVEGEEYSADADDDDEEMYANSVPLRVRPGEHLLWEPTTENDEHENVEVELSQDDMAIFIAEDALDTGIEKFLGEMFIDGLEWDEEEEV